MKPTTGFLLGKFYPPHAGHHYLIEEAAKRCEQLIVMILAHPVESIPLSVRQQWLRERHPDPNIHILGAIDPHPIDYSDPAIWNLHMDVIWKAMPSMRNNIDIAFGSERYVEELARRMGALTGHIVDLHRKEYPVSGTAVRKDPVANWQYLTPPVRAYLTKRVVLLGAESTGTTTMAKALAQHYNTVWVPEYGRYFSEAVGLGYQWQDEDFVVIADEQGQQEDELALRAGPVMFCDTDALATTVWARRYMGHEVEDVQALANGRVPSLYLVTTPDGVPWEQDGTRESEYERRWMTDHMTTRASAANPGWTIELGGSLRDRMAKAIEAVDDLLAQGSGLTDPVEYGI